MSYYDSGVDNDEKEGDRRTKQDVDVYMYACRCIRCWRCGAAEQTGNVLGSFLTELETVAPSRCRSSFMTCTMHITMLSFHKIAQDSFLHFKNVKGLLHPTSRILE